MFLPEGGSGANAAAKPIGLPAGYAGEEDFTDEDDWSDCCRGDEDYMNENLDFLKNEMDFS